MKNIINMLFVLLLLLLSMVSCDKNVTETDEVSTTEDSVPSLILGTSNQDKYGLPYKIKIPVVSDDEKSVAFAMVTDTHLDADNWLHRNNDHEKKNRSVVQKLNSKTKSKNILGVVHMGDMTNGNNTQYVVAFRQIYEDDYPGHDGGSIAGTSDKNYTCYSGDDRINRPVFPTIGNHDVPTFHNDPKNWRKAADYVNDRVIGANGLVGHYKKTNYAWRWGQYIFIQLGLWAGSYEHEDKNAIDQNKIEWLKKLLADNVGDSNMGVLIFQHFGWDSFSSKSDWWSKEMRNLEINVLCRRENSSDNANPYNVIGIFTGHTHKNKHEVIDAGTDKFGNEVKFDNYVIDDAYGDGGYGFATVSLTESKMELEHHDVKKGSSSKYSKEISMGILTPYK